MTVSTSQSGAIFLGNGATATFSFSFIWVASTDINVYYTDATGLQTLLNPSQYTLNLTPAAPGATWGIGGTVTYPKVGSPIASGTSLAVDRILPLTQTSAISNQGGSYPTVTEQALDILCMQAQQIAARTGLMRGVWQTLTVYNFGDIIQDGANGSNTLNYYICVIPNTSGTWSTDLAAGDWALAINVQQIGAYSTSASASATAAAASASSAAISATNAATSATNASTQATNAAASATSASTSATTATTQASAASGSATTASTQATNAAASAASASTSATTASTQASAASSSASSAATSASAASTSASAASTSATTAATQATNASNSATSASTSATTATTQAGNASTSATNAAASATTASTQATNAAASATTASTQATNAGNSASAAATSATSASTSATAAANAVVAVVNKWAFATSTTMADPGTGNIRLDNATIASATQLAISALSNDSGNPNLDTFIAVWANSTHNPRGFIRIEKDATHFAIFGVNGALTDNTTWLQIPISYISGAGTFSAADVTYIGFVASGNDGSGSGTVTTTGSPVSGNLTKFTGGTSISNGDLSGDVLTSGSLVTTIKTSVGLAGSPTTTTQTQGTSNTTISTTAYVDTAIANAIAGVNPAVAVQAATTANVAGYTYNNGASGIGATLTQNSAAVVVIDGYTLLLNDRVLFKDQSTAANNGVYKVTTLGTGIIPAVFTRALDFDMPSDMNNTGAIPVINGTANTKTQWVLSSTITTVGTDAVTFAEFSVNPTTLLSNSLTSANIFVGSAGNVATGVAMTGDVTITNAGVTAIKTNVALAGSPTTTTQSARDNSTKISTTAYVDAAIGAMQQNSQSAAYTTVLGDAGKQIYHPAADTSARTWTIDSNANVAYPVGTLITFTNDTGAGVITIAITSDTLVLAGTGATGSRSLAASGTATAQKMTATRWMISGSGLT